MIIHIINRLSLFLAQIDIITQISFFLSATQANITFIIQIPETIKTIVQIQTSKYFVISATAVAKTKIVH